MVAAVVGTQALKPTLAAIRAGKDIALANKELLVMAGKFVMAGARENNVAILPLDSEHNAIFQCLNGERARDVAKLIITGLRRHVPRLHARADALHNPRTGSQTPQLENGPQGDDRLVHPREQGA